jgi:DNA (cytosine-5)-methyltransferase 1
VRTVSCTDDKLTIGSIFSGIGGFELGLERTGGFTTSWQCEIHPYARKVLEKIFPGVPCYQDIKELYETVFPRRVDVLCGGFPCQPFSTAGRRQGEKDNRYLWPEFVRLVREIKPRWVLAENVPGLLSIDSGRIFGRIIGDLASCGYVVEWDTISAASLGALHARNRLIIEGHLADPRLDGEGIEPQTVFGKKEDVRRDETGHLPSGRHKILDRSQVDRAERESIFRRDPGNRSIQSYRERAIRSYWSSEPLLDRVADGIPNWLYRNGRLGNAICPQVAEYVGECVLEHERKAFEGRAVA